MRAGGGNVFYSRCTQGTNKEIKEGIKVKEVI